MLLHLNIGTNIGHRHANLGRGVAELYERIPGRYTLSLPVESEPWGYESPNPYLNLGVMIETDTELDPLDILRRVEEAQRAVSAAPHRDADGAYRDRLIDIDIIAVDAMVLDHPRLTLPHPRMHLRAFVLGPMAELDPGWVHPLLGQTPSELLKTLMP